MTIDDIVILLRNCIQFKRGIMHNIYSKSINIYTILLSFFSCFASDLLASETVDYTISDTIYLEGSGLIEVDVSQYLNSFQTYNSGISSIESLSETTFNCDHSSELIQVLLFNGGDTLYGYRRLMGGD